jgi:4-hydroxy-3-methylbut-2-enyl diphosphate reductase
MSLDLPLARAAYRSPVIDRLREANHGLTVGRITVRCARNFGFCWGVDKAVSMILEAIAANPGRRIWLLSPIIHNPAVNRDLAARGVGFLKEEGSALDDGFARVAAEDLVVIPAFSAEVEDIERLAARGCSVLDTTCPWVERPHRRTERLIGEGFSLVIHGKVGHDETRATCSLIRNRGGHYVVVSDLTETDALCRVLDGQDAAAFEAIPETASSPGFDPKSHLQRVGLINQTTMLASESREIARRIGEAMAERYGQDQLKDHFRDFDTICSATQENQDAVLELLAEPDLDLMIVVGGYSSSNTHNLARIAARRVPTYHIEEPREITQDAIQHQPVDLPGRVVTRDWLPEGPLVVGFTAGASTPDQQLGQVIERVIAIATGNELPAEIAGRAAWPTPELERR